MVHNPPGCDCLFCETFAVASLAPAVAQLVTEVEHDQAVTAEFLAASRARYEDLVAVLDGRAHARTL